MKLYGMEITVTVSSAAHVAH